MSRLKIFAAVAAFALLGSLAHEANAGGFRVMTAGYYPALYGGPVVQNVGYSYSSHGVGYGMWGVGYGSHSYPYWYPYSGYSYPAVAFSGLYSSRFYRHYPVASPIYSSAYYGPTNYSINYAPYVYTNYANVQVAPAYTAYPAYSAFYGSYGYNSMGCNCW